MVFWAKSINPLLKSNAGKVSLFIIILKGNMQQKAKTCCLNIKFCCKSTLVGSNQTETVN